MRKPNGRAAPAGLVQKTFADPTKRPDLFRSFGAQLLCTAFLMRRRLPFERLQKPFERVQKMSGRKRSTRAVLGPHHVTASAHDPCRRHERSATCPAGISAAFDRQRSIQLDTALAPEYARQSGRQELRRRVSRSSRPSRNASRPEPFAVCSLEGLLNRSQAVRGPRPKFHRRASARERGARICCWKENAIT
jgi:hypothetical protein